jgi:hypothetical protein
MVGWQMVLVAVAVLFLAFLLWQMRPDGTRRSAVGADVRAARARARAATSPRARAEALCEAGSLALRGGARWTAATGSFLRAMNADPTWPESVRQLVLAFHRRRPRMLEKILWRRLGHLPWDDAHRPVLLAIAAGLRGLYERERRDAARAAVFRRLEDTFQQRVPAEPPEPR